MMHRSHDPYDSASWNACEPDKSQEVKMICRSLTTLRLELSQSRVATVGGNIVHVTCCDSPQLHCLCAPIDWTTDKLRKEYELIGFTSGSHSFQEADS